MNLNTYGFPGGSDSKESTCHAGDLGLILGLGRSPGEGNGYPLWYFGLENSKDRGACVGYSPWSHKDSDMTEQLTHTHTTHTRADLCNPYYHNQDAQQFHEPNKFPVLSLCGHNPFLPN